MGFFGRRRPCGSTRVTGSTANGSTGLRCDNGPGNDFRSATTPLGQQDPDHLSPAHAPWDNSYINFFNRRLRTECLNRNHWTCLLEARCSHRRLQTDHNLRHRHTALGYGHQYAAA
ncbi:transposase [Nocardia abscessus]|nr:transposase [Nocardia abscessus]